MYLKFLRFIVAVCLLTTFWSVIRISLSVFELLAPIVILCALAYKPKIRGPELDSFKLVFAGLAIMTLAYVISAPSSYDPVEHLEKVAKLLAAFLLVIGLSYVLANRRILTTMEIFYLLAFSSVMCSFVAILQGQFGILTGLIPQSDPGADVSRTTGLAEHPIEAGCVAAYGAVLAIGIGILRRKWWLVGVMLAIDAYSMKFSASITAVLGFVTAATSLCLYTRAYKALLVGIVAVTAAVVVGASLANNSGRLAERLTDLAVSKNNFGTVQTREIQLQKALELINAKTLLFGNGYAKADLPYRMDIHNGIIAAVFHYGLLGLIAQCLLIWFFLSRMRSQEGSSQEGSMRAYRGVLLGCIAVFTLSYISGPPQARPSLWAPVIMLGAILTVKRATEVAQHGRSFAAAQHGNARVRV
jgi:hypothetical protein